MTKSTTEGAPQEVLKKRLPRSGGPKPKYREWMCEKLVEVAEQGGHVSQMCREIGIKSQDTFFRWVRENEDFKKAYTESKVVSKAFYENLLLMGGVGQIKGFNFNSIAMIMNNKFPDEYKRVAGSGGTEINIGNINSIDLSPQQLAEKIKSVAAQLQSFNAEVPQELIDGACDEDQNDDG